MNQLHPPERRHTKDQVGFFFFGRFYSLGEIGRGLVFAASVAGVVGGCFAYGMGLIGQKVVPADKDFKETSIRNDSFSMVDRREIHGQLDSIREEQEVQRQQLELVGLVSCAQLQPTAPQWLQDKCHEVLRQGREQ